MCARVYVYRYRFVVHGCVDGYSRAIIYLECNDNNRATTQLDAFRKAITKWGLPSRIRTDKGLENIEISKFMLSDSRRGPGRGSVITGRSVHNTRIERLWRDVNTVVLYGIYDFFRDLEDFSILDVDSELHILCLHMVYMNAIRQKLYVFQQIMNDHPIRTEHNMSPKQLFVDGLHQIAGVDTTVANEYYRELPEV